MYEQVCVYACRYLCMHMLYICFIHVLSYAHVCPVCMCIFMWRKDATWTWLGFYVHCMQLLGSDQLQGGSRSGQRYLWNRNDAQLSSTRSPAAPCPVRPLAPCDFLGQNWGMQMPTGLKTNKKDEQSRDSTWLCHRSRLTGHLQKNTCLLLPLYPGMRYGSAGRSLLSIQDSHPILFGEAWNSRVLKR